MHITDFEDAMENEVTRVIRELYPLDWKEDILTHEIVKTFRDKFRDIDLYGSSLPLHIQWEAYKFHGVREYSHGDIGILVRYRTPNGTDLEGAGFIEAKIRRKDTSRYLGVRHEQVSRILERSPQTCLLLYDYHPVPTLDNFDRTSETQCMVVPFFKRTSIRYSYVTHSPILPLRLAAHINQYDDSLYQFCHSLSHQFTQRYFHLHDLDFRHSAIESVKGFPSDLGSPRIILVILLATPGQELPEDFRPNQERYSAIE